MVLTTVTYLKSVDFPQNDVHAGQLFREIEANSGITEILVRTIDVISPADNVDIIFENALTTGEKTTLDGIIATHIPSVDRNENTIPIVPMVTDIKVANYFRIATFVYEGSNVAGNIDKILATAHKDSGATNYLIKVYDSTNNNTIVETTFTNNTRDIVELTTISNIPTNNATLEIHAKKTGGSTTDYAHIDAITFYCN